MPWRARQSALERIKGNPKQRPEFSSNPSLSTPTQQSSKSDRTMKSGHLIILFFSIFCCNATRKNKKLNILRGTSQDPFLLGYGCRPQIEKGLHFVPDPQFCDRYLECQPGSNRGIAIYCARGQGFDKESKFCRNLPKNGKLESCEKRGATQFVPNKKKPFALCQNNPGKVTIIFLKSLSIVLKIQII